MDNMTDKQIKKLADEIANALITKALQSQVTDWEVNNNIDH